MMVKDSKYARDLHQGNTIRTELQVVAFKATSEEEEA
jgi:hypothetical protein